MAQARQLKAILFSDVVDSSVKIFADELIAIQRIREDLNLIRQELQRHNGSLVKSLGDGVLATFDCPTEALEFIQDVLQRLGERGRQSLEHRFGLHTGEIYADGDDIVGQGVHLASRLQAVSPSNGVTFVRSTYELIDPRMRRLAVSMGELDLKGLPHPVHVYCLGQNELLAFADPEESQALKLEALLQDTPYELVRPLGHDANKPTLLLRECQRDRFAVMKLIPSTSAAVEALQLEAVCLDRLRHPRIPRVIDGYAKSGKFCFIQEYIPGPSLQGSLDFLRRKQRLAEFLRQVLQILEVVHAAGLVHGDIHPANLLPSLEDGQIFLVDFSLLTARIGALRAQNSILPLSVSESGRPFYSAPERARFGRLTPGSDLYALGVTALSLYTGQAPENLYDESKGCWRLEDLEDEAASWLSPLLQDLAPRRLQRASDALCLLDQSSIATTQGRLTIPKASESTCALQVVSKAALRSLLAINYGPMVDLLLESQPSVIPQTELSGLRERLVLAGLTEADVSEALNKSQTAVSEEQVDNLEIKENTRNPQNLPGDHRRSPQDINAHALDPSSVEDSSLPVTVINSNLIPPLLLSGSEVEFEEEQLRLIRSAIGPIADLIWTDELRLASQQDPERYMNLLLEASIPEEIASRLVGHSKGAVKDSSVIPKVQPLRSTSSASSECSSSVHPTQVLADLIGPIGITIWEQVANLPSDVILSQMISKLRAYGLSEDLLEELRRRLDVRAD